MQTAFMTCFFRLCIAALAGAGCTHAMAEIVLYENDDYNGRSQRVVAPMTNLDRMGFNDAASSVVVRSGNWQLCADADFRGQCITLNPGSYRSMRAFGMNDRISSLRMLGGNQGNPSWGAGWGGSQAAVSIYEHADYGGRSFDSLGSANLAGQGFNDKASSIVVRSGRWEFCSDADFRGRCTTLGPGSYGNLGDMGMNDAISSFRASGGAPVYGGGRPHSSGWAGDDGSGPEVEIGPNRGGRVTFRNGCVVYYNPDGQRFQNLPACHGQQIPRADEAMARYRAEKGFNRSDGEHPWVVTPPRGYRPDASAMPEVIVRANREGEVIFRNNCVVYYTARGRRHLQQPSCTPEQLRRADQAMAAQRQSLGF
jgi:Beta/Gamma crystallin